jgi:hypothetical protein
LPGQLFNGIQREIVEALMRNGLQNY